MSRPHARGVPAAVTGVCQDLTAESEQGLVHPDRNAPAHHEARRDVVQRGDNQFRRSPASLGELAQHAVSPCPGRHRDPMPECSLQ
jgi:hypothetical protein